MIDRAYILQWLSNISCIYAEFLLVVELFSFFFKMRYLNLNTSGLFSKNTTGHVISFWQIWGRYSNQNTYWRQGAVLLEAVLQEPILLLAQPFLGSTTKSTLVFSCLAHRNIHPQGWAHTPCTDKDLSPYVQEEQELWLLGLPQCESKNDSSSNVACRWTDSTIGENDSWRRGKNRCKVWSLTRGE